MFTGLVQATARVLTVSPVNGIKKLTVIRPEQLGDIKLGESISVNGVCLTVSQLTERELNFDIGIETLQKTTLSDLKVQDSLNLEMSLTLKDKLGGHLVSGHIDGKGCVEKLVHASDCLELEISVSEDLTRWMVSKGSVAVNGVSLTINKLSPVRFSVMLIPETIKRTNLGALKVGDFVNIECDQIVKIVCEKFKPLDVQSL